MDPDLLVEAATVEAIPIQEEVLQVLVEVLFLAAEATVEEEAVVDRRVDHPLLVAEAGSTVLPLDKAGILLLLMKAI